MDETDQGLIVNLIDEYIKLQRIKTAPDRDKELDYQIKNAKVKLKLNGIATENLDNRKAPLAKGGRATEGGGGIPSS